MLLSAVQNDSKWDLLQSLLREMQSAVLAYSGGVDSSLLLKAAADVMGPGLIAVTADSATYPPEELAHASAFARSLGVSHRVIPTKELDYEEFVRNPPDRCYHCKRELFGLLRSLADREGHRFIIDGSNLDDRNDHRPGRRAGAEFSVRSPLAEAGLTKSDVRRIARALGLPMWDKPAMACLSSRIPYGSPITREVLNTVHSAEEFLRTLGITQMRVRHHGDTARIEVDPREFGKLTAGDAPSLITTAFKRLGFTYVCLDLEGYRTGSLNTGLGAGEPSSGAR